MGLISGFFSLEEMLSCALEHLACCPQTLFRDLPTGTFDLMGPEPNLALSPRSLPLLQCPFQPYCPKKERTLGLLGDNQMGLS